jgi:DNA polymerase-3 subunit epsilon
MSSLLDLYALPPSQATYVIVDFETVTPAGRPAEPIELAALRLHPGLQHDTSFRFARLISPPAGAPLTAFDTAQTGITQRDIDGQPVAEAVLADFDRLQTDAQVFVAQNASYESNIFLRFSTACPRTANSPFIDTVALARLVLPDLRNHRLDTLAEHFHVPIPSNRHRALPDVQMTMGVFVALLDLAIHSKLVHRVGDLVRIAGIAQKKTNAQPSLF